MSDKSDHWSAYWKSGVMTSLPQDFAENYDGELASFWQSVVDALDDDANVLDICTGNLALPLLFTQIRGEKRLKLFAVDRAEVNSEALVLQYPQYQEAVNEIAIQPPTDLNDLYTLSLGEFDLISSQYGLEYADAALVAPILFDHVKPGGRLVFVSHAADTAIAAFMKEENQAFLWLQQMDVFESMTGFAIGNINATSFKKRTETTLKVIHQKLVQKPNQLLQIFHQALGGLSQMDVRQLISQKEKIKDFAKQHWMAQMRAQDLLQVTENIQQNPEWYKPFEEAGFELISKNDIYYRNKHHAGTAFEYHKKAI